MISCKLVLTFHSYFNNINIKRKFKLCGLKKRQISKLTKERRSQKYCEKKIGETCSLKTKKCSYTFHSLGTGYPGLAILTFGVG